jgi:tripartite-type tricarboxylate transporter receptor subunit TctC
MRRRLTGILPVLLAALLAATAAGAQDAFPDRPVRIIVPFPPGGPVDAGARIIAAALPEQLGQPVVVENRSGAGGSVGVAEAARAAPDGHTLVFSSTGSLAVNVSLIPNLSYDTRRDFAPVSVVVAIPMLMVARAGLPARTVQEAVALARQRPNALTYATTGPGGPPHLLGELMRQRSDVHMTMVAYRGAGPTITAILAGEVDVTFLDPAVLMPHVREGRMRALAVSSRERNPALPGIPSLVEAGLDGAEIENWYALLAPAATPPQRVRRLHAALAAALARPEALRVFTDQGARVLVWEPERSAAFVREEVAKWAEVVRAAGMRPE